MIFINLKEYRFFHSKEHRFQMFHKKETHRDSEKKPGLQIYEKIITKSESAVVY